MAMPTPSMQELRTLAYRLSDLSALVATALEQVTRALVESDHTLAEHVLEQAAEAAALGAACEEQACALLALHAPRDGALRTVVVAIHTAADLTRMGELVGQVADLVRKSCGPLVPVEAQPAVARLGKLAVIAAREVGKIVAEPDVARYGELSSASGLIDVAEDEFRAWIRGRDWDHGTKAGVDVMLLAGLYGRFADLAAQIARRIDELLSGLAPCPVVQA
jgi:phosphate transport system protein